MHLAMFVFNLGIFSETPYSLDVKREEKRREEYPDEEFYNHCTRYYV
jgi:hypothetical protein